MARGQRRSREGPYWDDNQRTRPTSDLDRADWSDWGAKRPNTAVKDWPSPREFDAGRTAVGAVKPWSCYESMLESIAQARTARGLTVRAVAVEAGLAASAVSNMLTLATWPRLSTVQRVAAAVGLELTFDGDPDVLDALIVEFDQLHGADRDDLGNLFWLAQSAGVRPNTVYDLMLGRTDPKISTVLALLGTWDRLDGLELVKG